MSVFAYQGDHDWGRIVFFVIVLIVWGVRALGEWWKANREQILGKFKQLDEEFKKRGGRFTMPEQDDPVPPAPVYRPPTAPARKPVVVTQYQPMSVIAPAPQSVAAAAPSVPKPVNPLTGLLRQRDSVRRAMILKEVLGAPKALQMDGDHII